MIKDRKARWQSQEIERIKSDFKIMERGGTLYLTFNGVAFKEIDETATAKDIALQLKETRDTFAKFEGE